MRIISGMMLAAALGAVLGCGGKPDTPPQENKGEPAPTPGVTPPGDPNAKTVIPAAVPATWEMDPAKHTVPSGPVSGMVNGKASTLGVWAEKQSLVFFRDTNGQREPLLELHLSDPDKPIEEYSVTVKPDQKPGPDVPNVVHYKDSRPVVLQDKYSLTLKLGKRQKGKLGGTIYLSLPDESKSFIAGTFSADWVRAHSEPPGPDDAPFVQGMLTITGVAEPDLWLGYVRLDPHDPMKDPVSDVIGTVLKEGSSAVASPYIRSFLLLVPGKKPAQDPARYEITRLEPGHYWVFATVKGGPAAWKFVTIEPNTQLTLDFKVDSTIFGSLAVEVPGTTPAVSVLPKPDAGKSWPETLVVSAASISDLNVDTAANKPDPAKPISLTFPRLAPGKYEVWVGDQKQDVEIKAKETAKVEFKKK